MIALNLILMTTVVIAVVALLAWAILGDHRGRRAARAGLSTAGASGHGGAVASHAARTHQGVRARRQQSSLA